VNTNLHLSKFERIRPKYKCSISVELENFDEPSCQNPKLMVMVLLLVMKFEECIQNVWHINNEARQH
jgi:hypothetical protein